MTSIATDPGAGGGGGGGDGDAGPRSSAPVIIDDVQKALTGWDAHLEDPLFRALGGAVLKKAQGESWVWGQGQGQG